jgi:protoporphyrin/coproporphyrin ferrochelatase
LKGVLLMAYGSPASMEAVEEYYTHIRGGKKPSGEQLADLVGRYSAIGGPSPLLEITRRQAAALEAALAGSGPGTKVYAGMKHSPPFIGEVVRQARSDGVRELLCVALAPHYSRISIGGYMKAVEEANSALGGALEIRFVKSWHDNPKLVSLWAERVRRAGALAGGDDSLVFTAHSLPERILAEGDPYRDQLMETSRLVAAEAGRKNWTFAFQSASTTGEPWLGPDIVAHLQRLYEGGARNFLLAQVGFLSDHLEILYDIDVECKGWATERGASLVRCDSPNDSPDLVECLRSLAAENGFA